jgi:hypothetical protein
MDLFSSLPEIERRLSSKVFILDSDQVATKIQEFEEGIDKNTLVISVSRMNIKYSYEWLICVKTLTQCKGAADTVITYLATWLCGKVENICIVTGDNFCGELKEICKSLGQECYVVSPSHHLGIWNRRFNKTVVNKFIPFASYYLRLYCREEAYTLASLNETWPQVTRIPYYVDLRLEYLSRWKKSPDEFCSIYNVNLCRFKAWLHKRRMNDEACEEAIKSWLLEKKEQKEEKEILPPFPLSSRRT